MARTYAQIKQEILDRKALEPELSALSSVSEVSIWRLMVSWIAMIIYLHEQIFETVKSDINIVADSAIGGTKAWYSRLVLAFQYGDTLALVDGVPGYQTIDTDLQVVKRVAIVRTSAGSITIKVAKLDSDSLPTPLRSADELGLEDYLDEVQMVGDVLTVLNVAADQIEFYIIVYYIILTYLLLLYVANVLALGSSDKIYFGIQ
jgi:hypothetical protein